jgi:hypothetical protein
VFDKFIETLKGAAAAITSTDEQGDIVTVPDSSPFRWFRGDEKLNLSQSQLPASRPKEVGTRRGPKERYREEGCEEKEGQEAQPRTPLRTAINTLAPPAQR